MVRTVASRVKDVFENEHSVVVVLVLLPKLPISLPLTVNKADG